MTTIPVVWQTSTGGEPPEWVLFEMQGELQYKGNMGKLEKKGAATTASSVTTFEGLEMGILSPHAEHGPTKPELRIGNLVVPGKLVKLPKPLLVLTTARSSQQSQRPDDADESMKDDSDRKRRRDTTETKSSEESTPKKQKLSSTAASSPTTAASSSSSSTSSSASSTADSSFPTAILQTVALIRHKYVFAQRPFSICEVSTAPTVKTEQKEPIKQPTSASKIAAH